MDPRGLTQNVTMDHGAQAARIGFWRAKWQWATASHLESPLSQRLPTPWSPKSWNVHTRCHSTSPKNRGCLV